MATLHRPRNARGKESPFWAAKFRDGTGRIVNRSTKRKVLREAQKVAQLWEDAARKARLGELTQAASVKLLGELMEATTGEALKTPSVKETFENYVARCKAEKAAESTLSRYAPVFRRLLAHLGPVRAEASVASLSVPELENWQRKELESGLSEKTVNMGAGVVRAALNAAKRRGEILANPAEALRPLKTDESAKEPFTDDEIARLVAAATGDKAEWRGAVLVAAWSGLRLADVASLTWGAVDLEAKTLTITPAKTQKPLRLPLADELSEYLDGLVRGVGKAPLFPGLAGRATGSAAGLSNEFARLMKAAGVVGESGREKTGRGRQMRTKTFHSLRHSFVSRLVNSDVPQAVRMAMAGHATEKAHRNYVHLDFAKQSEALAKLAKIGGAKK
jgi:integrase